MAKSTTITRTKPDLDTTVEALKQGEVGGTTPASVFYGLSGLTSVELNRVRPVWAVLKPDYRLKVMERLAETAETDFEMDYRAFGIMGLSDIDARVRQASIEVLWEDESVELMRRLIDMANQDVSVEVRAAAVNALGRFIMLGEMGDFSENEALKAQDAVIALLKDEMLDVEIRRRALEAISNSSNEIVPDAINRAYRSGNHRMKVSAVFAMGRSSDERWGDAVLHEIESDDPEIRYEAARAVGELELTEAIPHLGRLLAEDDREIKEVAVWSLGEIGGREALRILNAVLEVAENEEDDDLVEATEDAIGNASMIGGDIFPTVDIKDLN
ncbi:MAG TPA: HEAT repeat domain-containing protein [Phototrophicaceae bacterium]|jgi:HEAT repeat protein|nr:HEAT repeat domain-containing protein [Phototrophicaceae bacterium]